MHTNIQKLWKRAEQPILIGLAGVFAGILLGIIAPPTEPRMYCVGSHLQAHFSQQRMVSFEVATIDHEVLREAAPEQESSESSAISSSTSLESSSSIPVSGLLASSSSSSSSSFPSFGNAIFPIRTIPNWGAMKTPAEWERSYSEMDRSEYVSVPRYNQADLTIPMASLTETRDDPETIRILTAKLFYSTRFMGSYDLDAGEHSGNHPGIDLKLPEGTPVGAIAGGRIYAVIAESTGLGLHVIIEHRLETGETYYSIYGHLSRIGVNEGQDVEAGETIGRSGSTGRSSGPHLHLQVDQETIGGTTVNPTTFIATH